MYVKWVKVMLGKTIFQTNKTKPILLSDNKVRKRRLDVQYLVD